MALFCPYEAGKQKDYFSLPNFAVDYSKIHPKERERGYK